MLCLAGWSRGVGFPRRAWADEFGGGQLYWVCPCAVCLPLPSYHCCYRVGSAAFLAVAVLFIARSIEIYRCCLESALYARL